MSQSPHTEPDSEKPLTTGAVAKVFGVNRNTAAAWADAGLIPSFKTPGGHRRFRPEDVHAFTQPQHSEAIPA